MSFFASMLAGAADGVGKGMANEADLMERNDAKLALTRQQAQDRADLQRDRLSEQSALKLTLAEMRNGEGGGKGGAFNLSRELINADTPAKQQRLMEYVRASGDDNAAAVVGRMYGIGTDKTAQMPQNDDEGNQMPGPTSYTERAKYDASKGAQSLNRVMAIAMDPSKLKGYADGEAQTLRNDVASGVTLKDALKSGDRSAGAMNEALSPMNPKAGMQGESNDLAQQRIDLRREEGADKNARGEANISAREKDLLMKERKALAAQAKDMLADPADQNKAKARMTEIDDILKAPATPSRSAPASITSAPRSPKAAASAFRSGQTY